MPATLDELVEACKAVTAQGNGSVYGVGFTSSSPLSRWIEGVAEMSGATHMGYDYVNGVFDFSSWKPVIESAAKLYADGSVLPGSETQGVDNSRALFAQGAFAVWGNASQEAGVFTDQFPVAFDWGVAELPTMDGTVKGALSCTPNFGFTMLTSCENKDAAWEVIKYFSSEDFMKGYLEGGYLGRFEATADQLFTDYIRPQETGSHAACREAAVTGPAGGVAITGRPEFSLQVLPYTLEDLCAARHSDELTRADVTEVHIDYRQHGIGSESCCTTLPLCYRFEEKNFPFAFRLKIV